MGSLRGVLEFKGRGSVNNPPNRFERSWHEDDPEADDPDVANKVGPATEFLNDASRSIIATNKSPDVPFDASINPYRGCEHGCAYCYARPFHEYLGLSAGLDFETKILVKHDAPALLRKALLSPRWTPKPLAMSGVTDAYQPVERRLRITRGCLEVLAEFRNPVSIITKNRLVVRDIDLLGALASDGCAAVFVSITTLDPGLARKLEPRTSSPKLRLEAVAALAGAGIPVGVMVGPVIPGLTEHELPSIISEAASAGARRAGYLPLRLPMAVGPIFEEWLDRHAPGKKAKVLGRVRSMRGGMLNDPRFGARMRGEGTFATLIGAVFKNACQRVGMITSKLELSTAAFRRPAVSSSERQMSLFE
jgi:DNA repair photolyase